MSRTATKAEIRKTYLRLAKNNHPDLHPGDKGGGNRFKAIASANDILSDVKNRARFDSGESDASGTERPPEWECYRQHAEAGSGFKYDRGWEEVGGIDSDLFAELFGSRGVRRNARGADISYTFSVGFMDAVNGGKQRVTMGDGKTLDKTIPAGVQDGQTLRLRGQGQPPRSSDGAPGSAEGKPGDVLLEIHILPHPMFRRDGNDIRSKLALNLGEALAGAKLPVDTVSGTVQLNIPKSASAGTVLRLRGKGVPAQAIIWLNYRSCCLSILTMR